MDELISLLERIENILERMDKSIGNIEEKVTSIKYLVGCSEIGKQLSNI